MTIHISQYSIISNYFTSKLGVHCSFVQDKVTMFLTVDGKVYKIKRPEVDFIDSDEVVQRVIFEFEKTLTTVS